MSDTPSVESIRRYFFIKYPSGTVFWKEGTDHPSAGSVAGELVDGKLQVAFSPSGVRRQDSYHPMTKIAWAYHYGVWPQGEIVLLGRELDYRSANLTLIKSDQ